MIYSVLSKNTDTVKSHDSEIVPLREFKMTLDISGKKGQMIVINYNYLKIP